MSYRVVYRVRCRVTGEWKLTHQRVGILGGATTPQDFRTALEARHAARFLKRWRIVKVTIRSKRGAE